MMPAIAPLATAPQVLEEWTLTLLGGLDPSALIILSLSAVAGAVWTWRSLDPVLPLRTRLAITLARGASLLLVFAMLLQPTLRLRSATFRPARVGVLIDASGSMRRGVKGPRLDKAVAAAKLVGKELERRGGVVEWYCFTDEPEPIAAPSAAPACSFEGRGTDLRVALEDVVRGRTRTGPLSSIVLVSDGADTGQIVDDQGNRIIGWAASLGVPVNTVAITGPSATRDVSVARVRADRFAFTRTPTTIDVSLAAVGADAETVEVLLLRNGAVVRRASCEVVEGVGHVSFPFTPLAIGEHVLEVALSPSHQDDIPENDQAFFSLSAVRDKYRLLHLAGRPSWDQRFIRQALKDWPKMDVVSFYVLRSELQSEAHGSSGMGLIPFPTDELFASHLQEFDVVLMQDMDLAMVGIDRYLPKIADFVRQGGGLVHIAGPEGMPASVAVDDTLREILPVEPLPPGTSLSSFDSALFRPALLPEGRDHPLFAFAQGRAESQQIWQALPPVEGIARVARLAPSALALAGHPTILAEDGPMPVFAVREVGQGRTLAIATPSLWRWGFTGPMTGGPHDAYAGFWRRTVSWLTRDASLDRLRLSVTPSPARVGTPTAIELEVLDNAYQPIPAAPVEIELSWSNPDHSRDTNVVKQTSDSRGKYRLEWTPSAAGPYGLKVTVPTQGMSSEAQFLVLPSSDEVQHLEPQVELLAALAKETHGVFQEGALEPARFKGLDNSDNRLVSHVDVPLWSHPLALLLLLLVFGIEWTLRRRCGVW